MHASTTSLAAALVDGLGVSLAPGPSSPTGWKRVYAWKCDGSAVPGWPVTISGQVITSPTLANLDADPALEVLVTADNTRSSTQLHDRG